VIKSSALLATLVLLAAPVTAQQPSPATFRVFERGAPAGSVSTRLTKQDDEWLLEGSSDLPGFQLAVRQLEVHYDRAWHPRYMTVQLIAPTDSVIMHVAFGLSGGRTRTDIVRSAQATYGENTVTADTIVLPDLVSAYEGLAARLASASPGAELRAFLVPRAEVLLRAESVADEVLKATAGALATRHWKLSLVRAEGPMALDVWIAGGRLVRVDIPKEGITVVRDDLVR
jgi:hypothetical protein